MKKLLSMLTCAALLVGMALPMTVAAEEWEAFTYSVQDGGIKLESFASDPESSEWIDVVIPSEIDGKPVVALAGNLFEDDYMLNVLTVPATVTTIEEGALDNAWIVVCDADSAAEAYAQEWELLYCVDHVLYDPSDGSETPVPTEMEISQKPAQTVYQEGSEYLDLTGLELTFTFADDKTETWVYDNEEEPLYQNQTVWVMTDMETGRVDIEYLLCKASFTMTVVPNPVAKIEVTKWPAKGDYQGWELKVTEKDGSTKTVLGTDGTVLYYLDTQDAAFGMLLFDDADYGPLVAEVLWGQDEVSEGVSIVYMWGMEMQERPCCDVDGTYGTTTADALMILQAATKKITLTTEQELLADADDNGEITVNDALVALQAATGKLTVTTNYTPDDMQNMTEDDGDLLIE